MTQGISLHIGLNSVDPGHYGGWDGQLVACENDANDMEAIARSKDFKTSLLLTNQATRNTIIGKIQSVAKQLNSGDIFLLTYSGHGGQLPDTSGDEDDGLDETWCLFDGELVDDELYALWPSFASGVRILVFSDSCHSGTILKVAAQRQAIIANKLQVYKCMPDDIASRTYHQNKTFYDAILKKIPKDAHIGASAKLISGCQDNQLSSDGPFNGLFTGTLKQVWNGGQFKGNYAEFCSKIVARMPPDQTPNLYNVGVPDSSFDSQIPFTI